MQVYPAPSQDNVDGHQQSSSSDPQPLPPPAYQQPAGYGFGMKVAPTPVYNNFTTGYTLAHPAPPQPAVYNNQNLHMNMVSVEQPQPVVIIAQQAALAPPNYLVWSILNFLCCFWPLGLAAIIYSVKVGSARSPEEARRYSLIARNLNISATVVAPVLSAIIVGCYMGVVFRVSASSGYHPSSYYYSGSSSYSYSYSYTYSYKTYYSYYNSYYGYTTYHSYTDYGYQYAVGYYN